MSHLTIILGNQLFDVNLYKNFPTDVFMCEDVELCTHFRYHKHKIIHFLSAMRIYADALKEKGKRVHYHKLEKKVQYLKKLEELIKKKKVTKIQLYEIEDKFFEKKLFQLFKKHKLEVECLESPMFLCSRPLFEQYIGEMKRPLMNSFYIKERKRLGILLDGKSKPEGGKWSFDQENRKKIPKTHNVQQFTPPPIQHKHIKSVKKLVDEQFSKHPGSSENFWIPVDRKQSLAWLKKYFKSRFEYFGEFQDAIDTRAPFLYHSVISPMLNMGLIRPQEVIDEALKYKTKKNLNSVEGFIRQVMGWREFLRGIYQNYDETQQKTNFFKAKRKLTNHWYNGTTGVPPLDDAILKAQEWGYCHHIERLMVISNLMLLLEVHPQEAYKWFMEMFVDSSDWVMGPNVFGMGLFSDGGIFATKPYICGSNYLLKMSHYKKGEWCDAVDGLYWQFIERNQKFLSKNPRLSFMVKNVQKMDKIRKKHIYKMANDLKGTITK